MLGHTRSIKEAPPRRGSLREHETESPSLMHHLRQAGEKVLLTCSSSSTNYPGGSSRVRLPTDLLYKCCLPAVERGTTSSICDTRFAYFVLIPAIVLGLSRLTGQPRASQRSHSKAPNGPRPSSELLAWTVPSLILPSNCSCLRGATTAFSSVI